MRGSRNFHERGSNENGNFWSQTRGGGSNPQKIPKSPFLSKIFKFGGGGVRTPGPPLWIRACHTYVIHTKQIRKVRSTYATVTWHVNRWVRVAYQEYELRIYGVPARCFRMYHVCVTYARCIRPAT